MSSKVASMEAANGQLLGCRHYSKIIFVLLVVQLIFSFWPIIVKRALAQGTSIFFLVMFKNVFATIFLWVGVATERKITGTVSNNILFWKMNRKDQMHFISMGFSYFCNSVGFVLALKYVTSFNSALLHPSIPVFAVALGYLYGVDKLSCRQLIGTILCIGGAFTVVLSEATGSLSPSFIGNLLLLIQSFAMAYLLVAKKFVPHYITSIHTTAIYYTIGTLISLPVCIGILFSTSGFHAIPTFSLLTIAYGSLFVAVFCYVALMWATSISSSAVSSSSMMLQPPLTFLLSYAIEGVHTSGIFQLLGGVVIIIGLVLTLIPSTANQQHTSASESDNLSTTNSDNEMNDLVVLIDKHKSKSDSTATIESPTV